MIKTYLNKLNATVEAVQYTGENRAEMLKIEGVMESPYDGDNKLLVGQDKMYAEVGMYILRDAKGLYPADKEYFESTFEEMHSASGLPVIVGPNVAFVVKMTANRLMENILDAGRTDAQLFQDIAELRKIVAETPNYSFALVDVPKYDFARTEPVRLEVSPNQQHTMDPKADETPELTYGQKAVGAKFNPSGDDAVAACKDGFAGEIDRMNNLRNASTSQEQKRLASVAITELQTAQMWAVKALTWKD